MMPSPGSLFDAVLVRPSSCTGEKSDAPPLPPMKEGAGGVAVPDYAAWCPVYFRGCFECPDFLRDKVRFCRKWNRTFYGADGAELEIIDEGGEGAASLSLPEPTLPDGGRSWWAHDREVNGHVNTVASKKEGVLTA